MFDSNTRAKRQATTPGSSSSKPIHFDLVEQLCSGSALKQSRHSKSMHKFGGPSRATKKGGSGEVGNIVANKMRSVKSSLQEDQKNNCAGLPAPRLAIPKARAGGTNSSLSATSLQPYEGGQAEGAAESSQGLLAMSLQRVRDNATRQGAKRKLDPKKFTGVQSKVAKNTKILTKANKKQLKKKFQELLDAHQGSAAAQFHQQLSVPKRSETSSMLAERASQMRSSNKASRNAANSPYVMPDRVEDSAPPSKMIDASPPAEEANGPISLPPPAYPASLNESADPAVMVDDVGNDSRENAPIVSTKGKEPSRNFNGGAQPSKQQYISPYKASKTAHHRSPQRKQWQPLQNPQMTFGADNSPTRSQTQLPSMSKAPKTPASQRPKGSFMQPTASRMLKSISKSDLMQSISQPNTEEKSTFSKRRQTEQASPYENYQKTLKALEQQKKNEGAASAAARPQSALVAKTQAKPAKQKKVGQKQLASTKNLYIQGKANLENPEVAEEPQLTNLNFNSAKKHARPQTELGSVETRDALLQRKLRERGQASPNRAETDAKLQAITKEFSEIMTELEQRLTNKDMDWYQNQLDNDYASMRKNLEGSTTGSLVRKKGQNLVDQRAEIQWKTQLAIAEAMRKGSSKEMEKNKFKLDKTYERLAEENPLEFIDAVLANHPQQN